MTAKSNKGAKSAKSTGLPKMHWVNYDLTSEDKERLQDKALVDGLRQFDIESVVFEGIKYSIGIDQKNACFIASLTDKSPESKFYNHCLTGRGSTPADARVSLLYRHLVLAEGDWSFFSGAEDEGTSIYF